MAKASMVAKNSARRLKVAKYSSKRRKLKAAIKDKSLSIEERFSLQLKLNRLPLDSASARIRNRCEITGRPRGYYRDFGLCRNKIRELSYAGLITGVMKSSW